VFEQRLDLDYKLISAPKIGSFSLKIISTPLQIKELLRDGYNINSFCFLENHLNGLDKGGYRSLCLLERCWLTLVWFSWKARSVSY